MLEFSTSFKPLNSGDGYRAEMSSSVLMKAQRGQIKLAVEDPEGEFEIDISEMNWYDEKTVSGREGGVYDSIKKVQFEEDVKYAVFYFNQTRIPYMLALKTPA